MTGSQLARVAERIAVLDACAEDDLDLDLYRDAEGIE